MIRGIAYCDVSGCATKPVLGATSLSVETDVVFVGWEVVAGIVRCPDCVAADRWPDATVGVRGGGEPTLTPWLRGREQGIIETPNAQVPHAQATAVPRTVTDCDED